MVLKEIATQVSVTQYGKEGWRISRLYVLADRQFMQWAPRVQLGAQACL